MWSGHGNRHPIVGEDEPATRPRIQVDAMDDAGSLVRHPVNVANSLHRAHDIGEPTALLLIQVGQHCGVEDNQRRIRGCVREQPGEVDEEVTGVESGRVGGNHVKCPVQAFGPVDLFRPDKRGQPTAVVVTVGLQGVQVESGPPHHLG
jgi:hypothetical protein